VIPPPKYAPKQYYEMDEVEPQSFPLPYEDEIEPSETFDDDANDLDEGTVIGTKTYTNTNVYQQPLIDPYEKISPRMKVNKAERLEKQAPVEFNKIFKEDRPPMISDIEDQPDLDNSRDEWKTIQKKIDSEYEKKLKEVSDDAMKKLKAFQTEHKAFSRRPNSCSTRVKLEAGPDQELGMRTIDQLLREMIETDSSPHKLRRLSLPER